MSYHRAAAGRGRAGLALRRGESRDGVRFEDVWRPQDELNRIDGAFLLVSSGRVQLFLSYVDPRTAVAVDMLAASEPGAFDISKPCPC
jgi:hypothetical protein